jgi:hypothetical protein
MAALVVRGATSFAVSDSAAAPHTRRSRTCCSKDLPRAACARGPSMSLPNYPVERTGARAARSGRSPVRSAAGASEGLSKKRQEAG